MRYRMLVAFGLFTLFYLSRFPSLTVTDLAITTALAAAAIILTANRLVALAGGLISEALREDQSSFLSRFWGRYRVAGFNRDMTERAAKCFADIVCIKFGFDAIQVVASGVPATQDYTRLVDLIGFAIVLSIVLWYGLWLKLAVDFRADERDRIKGRRVGSTRIGTPAFARLFYKPVAYFMLLLYTPELFRTVLGTAVHAIVAVAAALFNAPELQAAPVAPCGPTS
jgi:hypothetical protein